MTELGHSNLVESQTTSDLEQGKQQSKGTDRLGQHAQTHLRLAPFSNTSPSMGPNSSFSSVSSGGGPGSFKNAARSFFHGSYHDESATVAAHAASYVRDYTAEIASMALESEEPTAGMLIPLPPPVEVPPVSSRASSSTLTALLRPATNSLDSEDRILNGAYYHQGGTGATLVVDGIESSHSVDPQPETQVTDFASQPRPDNYNEEDDFYNSNADQPLLGGSSYRNEDSGPRYGSEFLFEDSHHQKSKSKGSWLRSAFLSLKAESTFSVGSIFLGSSSDDDESSYVPSRMFHQSKPLFSSSLEYLQNNKMNILIPVKYIPSVVLGVLLNVLDGLSYGMILFPLGEPIFSALGPEGLSMFYVSCLVSQVVYSFGGSAFKGGVGSEMIEVVPFFHSMAYTLLARIGEDKPESVLATTVLAYAISSIVTGAVFFGLGTAKIGSLIGFFPRHILVGCIGGVGWFLMATGFEVSSRLEGNLDYNWETVKLMCQPITLLQWGMPLMLAVILIMLEHVVKHPLLVPGYFIIVFFGFHCLVSLVPDLSLQMLRDMGWIFASPVDSKPWYSFYELYNFSAVDWSALLSTVPAMFALTFFGILHVPINVPALAVSLGQDNVDVDRELIAHGISNALSGMSGSIQNYLVYTNSLLFIRSGGDSRMAGFMLAIATGCVMVAGPGVIGYIPVMVVGALIFLLGIELMREALYDTWGRVNRFEYFVIVSIIVVMGAWDFVYGIIVGIILACMSFVYDSSQKSAIKATYSGAIARSTVRRHPFQQRFLKEVGDEIFVCKLTGFLFFGTIVSVENKMREVILSTHSEEFKRIKYFVLDFQGVGGIDFSAAEAFTRMKRLLETKQIELILCSLTVEAASGLKAVGMWEFSEPSNGIHVFEDLNSALEWCENELLAVYYQERELHNRKSGPLALNDANQLRVASPGVEPSASPRKSFVKKASSTVMLADPTYPGMHVISENSTPSGSVSLSHVKFVEPSQPLTLLLQIIHDISPKKAPFWQPLCGFFVCEEHAAGTVLYCRSDEADGFYLVERGILKANYDLDQGRFTEAIVAGTTAGELPFFSDTRRTASMVIERDAVVWKLGKEQWARFLDGTEADGDTALSVRQEIAIELYKVALKLTAERFSAITAYVLTSAG
ncbi:sulfate transporter family-domain-containing protein [Lipomyces arxii]|uniref:sulfate transporter family-domain-containing protein n=1 Tax=Lipomyces arxii TaxID=56418 RepID=UPI0034CE97BB